MGDRFRIVANVVDVVPTDEPLPNLPVARALWLPRPDLKVAAAAWIYAGGAHHTSFSYTVTAEQLRDFTDMAGIEFLLIDENTVITSYSIHYTKLYEAGASAAGASVAGAWAPPQTVRAKLSIARAANNL